jgi:hypothetical protein
MRLLPGFPVGVAPGGVTGQLTNDALVTVLFDVATH